MASPSRHDSSPTVSFVVVPVPCAQCGDAVDCEVQEPVPAGLTAFCAGCRSELMDVPDLPPGYHLVHEIGRGGMGAVYLARHAALGLERAVKVVLPQGALAPEARERFLAEARLHARLNHPRIVQVHDLSEVRPGIFAIVMEYVPGADAAVLLRREGRPGLTPALAVQIADQALDALAYVHARGVVHCDVKDPNLLVAEGPAPAVKLSDFGLARTWAASGGTGRRRTEVTSGTIPYMSPEQAQSLALTPQSGRRQAGLDSRPR
jgi:serine/threonine protein kinase